MIVQVVGSQFRPLKICASGYLVVSMGRESSLRKSAAASDRGLSGSPALELYLDAFLLLFECQGRQR